MKLQTAIVTGGCGFIGSHLVDTLLGEGVRVVAIDNLSTGRLSNLDGVSSHSRLEIIQADISVPGTWADPFANADAVFHLAALADIMPSLEKPADYFQSNVTGTLHVLEAARTRGVKTILYAASSSCYGLAKTFPTPESAPIQPEYPYALTKFLGEQLLLHWAKVYRMKAVSLRLFNVYGPRSRTTGAYGAVFGVFLKQKLAGEPLTIVGEGTQKRDFVFVSDVVQAFLSAAKSDSHTDVYNVGSGRPVAVNDLANLLGGARVRIPKRPGEPDCTHADISKIRRALEWSPAVPFEAGVQRMLDHIEYWRDAPLWTPQSIEVATKAWFHYLQQTS